jgi:predicted transcriptional regulator
MPLFVYLGGEIMAVIRVNKTKDYTVMSNTHLKEKEMSLKAKGLLSLMLSLPENWNYSVEGLVAICTENKTAIRNTLKELETFGYLRRTKTKNEKGQFGYMYDVFERPEKPCTENLYADNLHTENQCAENPPQLNTKEENTNISNTKKENTKDNKKKERKKASGKNYEEIIAAYTENEDLKAAIFEFIKMRQLIKKPLTDYALSNILKKLDSYTNDDNVKVLILNQSIEHSWQGVFPLKDNGGNTYNTTVPETVTGGDFWA